MQIIYRAIENSYKQSRAIFDFKWTTFSLWTIFIIHVQTVTLVKLHLPIVTLVKKRRLLFTFSSFIFWFIVFSVQINDPENPSVLIEGVLFRARYLGSTQLISEGQPSKAMRMMQAQEAVGRIKVWTTELNLVVQWNT